MLPSAVMPFVPYAVVALGAFICRVIWGSALPGRVYTFIVSFLSVSMAVSGKLMSFGWDEAFYLLLAVSLGIFLGEKFAKMPDKR